MIIEKSIAKGTIVAPPSKSFAHRAIICAALSKQNSIVKNISFCEDINATLSCLSELGINFSKHNNSVIFKDNIDFEKNLSTKQYVFDCKESGSTLRFFIPICMFLGINSKFIGTKKLLSRPLKEYKTIAKKQKINFLQNKECLLINGRLKSPKKIIINGNISSQFITGLLFILPLLKNNCIIKIKKQIQSLSYINMTICVLKDFGINVYWKTSKTLFIQGGQVYKKNDFMIEGDFSNSVFFDIYNFLGGKVNILGLKKDSIQGDKKYLEYFAKLENENSKIDLKDCPDLAPILFVYASIKQGATFINTKRLQYKESNRGLRMKQELQKFGIKMLIKKNSIIIKKSEIIEPKQSIFCHNDHRIAMALVTLLTITGGKIKGIEAVKKSFPNYFKELNKIGMKYIIESQEEQDLLEN